MYGNHYPWHYASLKAIWRSLKSSPKYTHYPYPIACLSLYSKTAWKGLWFKKINKSEDSGNCCYANIIQPINKYTTLNTLFPFLLFSVITLIETAMFSIGHYLRNFARLVACWVRWHSSQLSKRQTSKHGVSPQKFTLLKQSIISIHH